MSAEPRSVRIRPGWLLGCGAAALTAVLAATNLGTAPAANAETANAETTKAEPIDPALALDSDQLQDVGAAWTESRAFQDVAYTQIGMTGVCAPAATELYSETNLHDDEGADPYGSNMYRYLSSTLVFRYDSAAEAEERKREWDEALASCAERLAPPGANAAEVVVYDVAKDATVDGVDVWGVHYGIWGYQLPDTEQYQQTFTVQRDDLLYLVTVDHYESVAQPHPPMSPERTVRAVLDRLG